MKLRKMFFALPLVAILVVAGCNVNQSSTDKVRDQQEQILQDAADSVGVPSVPNHRELRIMKDLYELRDQRGLVTYTYLKSEVDNKLCFYGDSIGYGIPYATQFSAPEAIQRYSLKSTSDRSTAYGEQRLPQAEPNGLYPPASADGTWVILRDPDGKKGVEAEYVEPKIIVSRFKHKNVPSCWGD